MRKINIDTGIDTTIPKLEVKNLLYLCIKNKNFIFNCEIYVQTDGWYSHGFHFKTNTGKYFHCRT